MTDQNDDVVFEPDSEEGTGTPEQKLKKLRDELKAVKKEREEYLAGWQRAKADYVNLERRMRESGADVARSATARVARGVIGLFDSLEAAERAAESASPDVAKGIAQVVRQLEEVLKESAVTRFTPEAGDAFDPNRHEPVVTVATESEKEDNSIAEVLQSGYEMNGLVIRPARVSVKRFS